MSVHDIIRKKLGVQRMDNLPFGGATATRAALAEVFAEAGYKRGAEVGVRLGTYSALLCQCNPELQLLSIDPYIPYRRHTIESMNHTYEKAKANLAPYNATLIRKTSVEASKDVPNESLDFVYIDAMHEFDPVIEDIIHWVPKVRRGGIVAGHDYSYYYQGGVILAVQAYTRAHNINPWYTTSCDKLPSWLWVR